MAFMRLVVCAAIRNSSTQWVVCGVRHSDCYETIVEQEGVDVDLDYWDEQGFVDQERRFMSRAEAWGVADRAGQIRRPTGFEKDYSRTRPAGVGDAGILTSENLY